MPIRVCIGACGSGKTHLLKHLVADAVRTSNWSFVVLDVNGEWPGTRTPWSRVQTSAGARRCALRGDRLTVVVPPKGARTAATSRPWATLANDLASVAIEAPHHVCLVLPEAHYSCREGYPLPEHIMEIVHAYRHPGTRAGLWVDTQHAARISKEVIDEACFLYLFGQGSARDLATVRELGGRELEAAVRACGARAARGDRGWHVALRPLDARGPFVLRRR